MYVCNKIKGDAYSRAQALLYAVGLRFVLTILFDQTCHAVEGEADDNDPTNKRCHDVLLIFNAAVSDVRCSVAWRFADIFFSNTPDFSTRW